MSKNEMDKAIEEMGAEQPLQTEPAAERPADGTVKAKPQGREDGEVRHQQFRGD